MIISYFVLNCKIGNLTYPKDYIALHLLLNYVSLTLSNQGCELGILQ